MKKIFCAIFIVFSFTFTAASLSFAASPELDKQLILAAKHGDFNKVKAMLAKGANVNAKWPNIYFTALMCTQKAEIARYLIEKGADINLKGGHNVTALHREQFQFVTMNLSHNFSHGRSI